VEANVNASLFERRVQMCDPCVCTHTDVRACLHLSLRVWDTGVRGYTHPPVPTHLHTHTHTHTVTGN
jgi:hypothetical protein